MTEPNPPRSQVQAPVPPAEPREIIIRFRPLASPVVGQVRLRQLLKYALFAQGPRKDGIDYLERLPGEDPPA